MKNGHTNLWSWGSLKAHNKHKQQHHKQHPLEATLEWVQSLKSHNLSLPLEEGKLRQDQVAKRKSRPYKHTPHLSEIIKKIRHYNNKARCYRSQCAKNKLPPTWLWFSNSTMYKASAHGLNFSVHWTISCSWWKDSGFWYNSSKSLGVKTKYLLTHQNTVLAQDFSKRHTP